MKTRVLFLAFCMIISIILSGQTQSKHLMEVQVTPPKFTGVENIIQLEKDLNSNSIGQYVANNFIYPEKNGYIYEGTSVVQFSVATNGELQNFKVINSVSNDIDNQIIKLIKSTEGMWKPGYNNGEPVAMEKEVAIEIKADETERAALKENFKHIATLYFNDGVKQFFVKNNPKKALRKFNNGILYQPYEQSLYYMRGLCRYELGQREGARQDWMRLKKLGGVDMVESYAEYNIQELKGYEELTTVFLQTEK